MRKKLIPFLFPPPTIIPDPPPDDPGGFTPTDITGLWGWWDFTDVANLYTTAAGAVQVANQDDPIGRAVDLSGSGHNLTVADADRPLWQSTGRALFGSGGAAKFLDSAASVNNDSFSLMLALAMPSAFTANTVYGAASTSAGSAAASAPAIADASLTPKIQTSATASLSFSYTVPAAVTNGVTFLVLCARRVNSDQASMATSAVQYGGVNMTKVLELEANQSTNRRQMVSIYRLINATAGAANFTATLAHSASRYIAWGVTYQDVDQTTPTGAVGTGDSTGPWSETLATSSANSTILGGLTVWGGDNTISVASGDATISDQDVTGADPDTDMTAALTNLVTTATGSYSTDLAADNDTRGLLATIEILPVQSGADVIMPMMTPGAPIWVKKTGNDTTGDGSSGNPYLTIGKAITVSVPGDEIIVGDGTYAEQLDLDGGFTTGDANTLLTIRAQNKWGALLTGVSGANYVAKILGGNKWIVLKDFDIQFAGTTSTNNHYVWIGNASHIRVTGCRITKLGDAPTDAQLRADYNAGHRQAAIHLDDGCDYIVIDNSEFGGINKGIHTDGAVTNLWIHHNTVYRCAQSCMAFNEGSNTFSGNVIEQNALLGSLIEDGIQFNPNFAAPNGTVMDNVGFLIQHNSIRDCYENAIDRKGARQCWVGYNEITGTMGSNNGLLTTPGNNNSSNTIMCGANETTEQFTICFNILYNNSGGIASWDKDQIFNNTLWYNKYTYLGAGTQTTKAKGIVYTEGTSFQDILIINNLIGKSYYGAALRDTATTQVNIGGNAYIQCNNVGYDNKNAVGYATLNLWKTNYINGTGWTGDNEASSFANTDAAASLFAGAVENPTAGPGTYDWTILDTSSVFDTGIKVTNVNGGVTASNTVVVDNAYPFRGDWGRSDIGVVGETIYIVGHGAVVVDSVNWTTKTLTLADPVTVADNAAVYIGSSATPGIGAGPFQQTSGEQGDGGTGSGAIIDDGTIIEVDGNGVITAITSPTSVDLVGPAATEGALYVICVTIGASSRSMRINLNTAITDATAVTATDHILRLGSRNNNDGNDYWTGEILEALVYDPGLSAADELQVINYLGAKHGVF